MDASIMTGSDLNAGAVATLKTIKILYQQQEQLWKNPNMFSYLEKVQKILL